jgi:hypothetical protein
VALAQIILFLKILKFSKKKKEAFLKENSFVKENGIFFEMLWIILFGNGIFTIN